MMRKALVIGIGGQAGSGKSLVARCLARHGGEIIAADKIGWNLLERGTPSARRVVEVFGPGILDPQGSIDRKKLGTIVFARRAAMTKLNRIVHPALLAELRRRAQAPGKPVRIIDAALLFSWGWQKKVDFSILVTATRKNKIARLMQSGLSRTQARCRIASQLPEEKMRKLSDCVIRNNFATKTELRDVCDRIWRLLRILYSGTIN
jgi:dephospho-CoA kinase